MKNKICIVGLGYVGLPLAHAFSSKYDVVGFDIASWRIDELNKGFDRTLELSEAQVKESQKNSMKFSLDIYEIKDCNIYDVCDPWVDKEVKREYNIEMLDSIDFNKYDSVVYAVGYEKFRNCEFNKKTLIIDVKNISTDVNWRL